MCSNVSNDIRTYEALLNSDARCMLICHADLTPTEMGHVLNDDLKTWVNLGLYSVQIACYKSVVEGVFL